MEPECSLPCSQQLAPGTCPEPHESSPYLPPYFPMIHSDVILPWTPRSSEWSLPRRVSDQDVVYISHLSRACYMPRPSHHPWLDHLNIWRSVQLTKLLIMQSSPASSDFLPLRSQYTPQHCSQTPSFWVLPLVWETKFHTHTVQQCLSCSRNISVGKLTEARVQQAEVLCAIFISRDPLGARPLSY
jgi:hypothetical protein